MRWWLIVVAVLGAALVATMDDWLTALSFALLAAYLLLDIAHERREEAQRRRP